MRFLFLFVPCLLFSQSLSIVSSAGYQSTIAPGSLAVAFGSGLATGTASATLNSNGQLPTDLAGASMQVNGRAAALIYASPTQVNFVVPDATELGQVPVVVRANGKTVSGTATVQNAAPSVFSSDSSGRGAGAILNAVTYQPGPFLVETRENGGDDLRTRLAVYLTGIRYAGNPSHDPTVTNVSSAVTAIVTLGPGRMFSLPVEYAGAAPGFFGLDQVNVVLPADLDNSGAVTLLINAEGTTANPITFTVNALPAEQIRLASMSFPQMTLRAGSTINGTVGLNGQAPAGGFLVGLSSDSTALQVPASLTVTAGQVGGVFTASAVPVVSATNATVTASANGVNQNATLTVTPSSTASLSGLTLAASQIRSGGSTTGTVTLSAPAPPGGLMIALSSDQSAVKVPASVQVSFGQTSATFSVTAGTVTSSTTARITASDGKQQLNAPLVVAPLFTWKLSATSVSAGVTVTGTITLAYAAPAGGAQVALLSNDPATVQLPASVTIAPGQTSASVAFKPATALATKTVTLTATYQGVSATVSLTVNGAASGALASLVVSPNAVKAGTTATGTVSLSGTAITPTTVNLSSSSVLVAQVPFFVTIPAGQTSASFAISTASVVAGTQTVTITASTGSAVQTAQLTVSN